jgi:catechol 2,3-dioxygenase-like lactoylglutathione lyase family enzyme
VVAKLRTHAEVAEAADPHVQFVGNTDVAIEVPDLEPAEEFYAGTLGFHVRARGETHLELDAGAFTLWVQCVKGPRRSLIPSLDVRDLAKARECLEEAGCRILQEAPDGRGFYFEDPFGFVMDVVEKR